MTVGKSDELAPASGEHEMSPPARPGEVEMSVSRSLAWMGMSQLLAVLFQFAAQVVLVRYLTLYEAGIYAIAFAVVGVLSLVQTLGLQALVVREAELTPEVAATAFTVNAVITIGLSLAIAATSFGGAIFFEEGGVRRVLLVLAATPLFAIFSFLPGAVLERHGRFREIALAGTAGSLAAAMATITLAVMGFSYMSAAYAQWANAGVTMIVMLAFGRRHASLRLSLVARRRVAEFGMQMLAINGISALGLRLSDVLLGRILGLSSLGLYSRASALNGLIWANVHLLIGRVMLVDFVDVHRQGLSLRTRYIRTVDITTVLLWPIFAGFAVIAGPFIFVVYGPRWVPAASPLVCLSIASMTQVAITMTWELFTATNQLRAQTRIEFIRSLFALSVFVAGCMISLNAAAAARVIEAIFALIIYRPYLNRMTDTTFRDFLPIYGRNMVLTLVAIGPAVAVMAMTGWRADVSLPWLGGGIAAGVLLWIGGLRLFRHPLFAEARDWIRR
jgi:O-antigen/teichoic acid export membrane protein